MTTDWQRDVRARLEAGETISGPQIRRMVGRRVHVYTFLERLMKNEGWVIETTLIPMPESCRYPVKHYRLVRKKKRVKPPDRPGPRTNVAERPTDVAIRRLLAGEELEGIAIARELGVSNSLLPYVKLRLEDQGYTFVNRRERYRVFTRITNLPTSKAKRKSSVKFGHFDVKAR